MSALSLPDIYDPLRFDQRHGAVQDYPERGKPRGPGGRTRRPRQHPRRRSPGGRAREEKRGSV
eukprot:4574672-Pyramimonas_sp.AAC.1